MKLGILLDSSATNNKVLFKNTDIRLIPLHITLEDNSDLLDIESVVEEKEIYNMVKDGKNLKTSQASPGELELVYDEMLTEYDHILHIPITKNLSSMMQTSFMVANEDKYEGKITIYQNTNLAANLLKEVALEIDSKNKNNEISTIDDAIKIIDSFSQYSFLGIVPGDLRKLARGGRGEKAISSVLNVLKTKVMIRWAEEPKKIAISRTISSIIEKVEEVILDEFKDGYELIFVSTPLTNEKITMNAKTKMAEKGIKYKEEFIPSIYTIHAGVDTVGFIIYKK